MVSTPTAYRISLGAALLLLAVVIYSALQPDVTVCGALDKNYQPIIAFELARSVADLQTISGAAPSECRAALAARMDFLNWGDNILFVPLYGAFLVFFFFSVRKSSPQLAHAAIGITLIACAADYLENTCLLHLSSNPDTQSFWLLLLPWATGVKWILLGVVGALGGLILTKDGGLRRLIALLCIAGLVIVLLAIINPHTYGRYASNGVTISWIVFLIADVIAVARWSDSDQAARIE